MRAQQLKKFLFLFFFVFCVCSYSFIEFAHADYYETQVVEQQTSYILYSNFNAQKTFDLKLNITIIPAQSIENKSIKNLEIRLIKMTEFYTIYNDTSNVYNFTLTVNRTFFNYYYSSANILYSYEKYMSFSNLTYYPLAESYQTVYTLTSYPSLSDFKVEGGYYTLQARTNISSTKYSSFGMVVGVNMNVTFRYLVVSSFTFDSLNEIIEFAPYLIVLFAFPIAISRRWGKLGFCITLMLFTVIFTFSDVIPLHIAFFMIVSEILLLLYLLKRSRSEKNEVQV